MKTSTRSQLFPAIFALVLATQMVPVAAHADEYRPPLTPNWSNPFTDPLNNIAAVILAVTLILGVIAFIISAVLFIFGKLGGRGGLQDAGVAGMIWTLVGIVILVSISGIVAFATGTFSIN